MIVEIGDCWVVEIELIEWCECYFKFEICEFDLDVCDCYVERWWIV